MTPIKCLVITSVCLSVTIAACMFLLPGCTNEAGDPVDVATEALSSLPTTYEGWCSGARRCVETPLNSNGGSNWFGLDDLSYGGINAARASTILSSAGSSDDYCTMDLRASGLALPPATCSGTRVGNSITDWSRTSNGTVIGRLWMRGKSGFTTVRFVEGSNRWHFELCSVNPVSLYPIDRDTRLGGHDAVRVCWGVQ